MGASCSRNNQQQLVEGNQQGTDDDVLPGILVREESEKTVGTALNSSHNGRSSSSSEKGTSKLRTLSSSRLTSMGGSKRKLPSEESSRESVSNCRPRTIAHRTLGSSAHHRNPIATVNRISFGTPRSLPHYDKSPDETFFLRRTLHQHCLFEHVADDELWKLIHAFEMVTIRLTESTPDEDATIIRQGDVVDQDSAYFYVLYKGKCVITVDGEMQSYAAPGESFGELALLYDCPRMATVMATFDDYVDATESTTASEEEQSLVRNRGVVKLFRLDQLSFRKIRHDAGQASSSIKMKLLDSVSFLEGISEELKSKLAEVMVARPFREKEYLIRRGSKNFSWFIIERGVVIAKNISYGANHRWNGRLSLTKSGMYRDTDMIQYESFGHRSLLTGELPVADCVARSPGLAYTIDRETFQEVLGNLSTAILQANDQMKLKAIPVLAETTQLDIQMIGFLSSQIKEIDFPAGTTICEEGKELERAPAVYFLRSGQVEIRSSRMNTPEHVLADGYLGDDQLYADTHTKVFVSTYTATVVEDCTCGVLTLQKCRRILDTHLMGKPQNVRLYDSLVVPGTKVLTLDDLELHRIIGVGTFGQVWLVSRVTSSCLRRAYALKIQSMHQLCKSGQVGLIIKEKNIMTQFHSPFIAKIASSFKDDRFVYMVLDLMQGGELYKLIRSSPGGRLEEEKAKFYFACVAQGLSYMHRLGFVYRDLKPENVMLDDKGYATLVDLGFCKKITRKTYTLCGTPLYLAPEVILTCGYSFGADHWSLGVLLYEMLLGQTPFYESGMSKPELFRAILKHRVRVPKDLSMVVLNLIAGLLKREPAKRIGNLHGGEDDILEHPWLREIDYDALLLREVVPPYIPEVKDPLDDTHFADWNHVEDFRTKEFPELTTEEQELFSSF